MTTEYTVLTPEKVAVQFKLAGVASRVWAFIIDIIILYLFTTAFAFVLGAMAFSGLYGLVSVLQAFLILFLLFGYHAMLEGFWNGQTLGKKALGIRVKMADGSPVTPAGAFTRNILRIGDMLPGTYAVGIISIFFTLRSQRLGDVIADTVVVHESRNVERIPVMSPLTTTEHPLEHLVGDFGDFTPDEYLAVKTLCDRFPELTDRTQRQMLREVWQPIANKHAVPSYENIHPVYLMEAIVMKYARRNGLL